MSQFADAEVGAAEGEGTGENAPHVSRNFIGPQRFVFPDVLSSLYVQTALNKPLIFLLSDSQVLGTPILHPIEVPRNTSYVPIRPLQATIVTTPLSSTSSAVVNGVGESSGTVHVRAKPANPFYHRGGTPQRIVLGASSAHVRPMTAGRVSLRGISSVLREDTCCLSVTMNSLVSWGCFCPCKVPPVCTLAKPRSFLEVVAL